jgi:FixJ family two-component response regulator
VTSPFIAIVDDDEVLCSSLVDLLRSAGYSGEPFTSAQALMASSDLPAFHCVIVDVLMPGTSGLDLVRKLREQGATTPVLLITALPDRRLDDAAIAAGANGLLRKPFDTEALLACIESCLASSHDPP